MKKNFNLLKVLSVVALRVHLEYFFVGDFCDKPWMKRIFMYFGFTGENAYLLEVHGTTEVLLFLYQTKIQNKPNVIISGSISFPVFHYPIKVVKIRLCVL